MTFRELVSRFLSSIADRVAQGKCRPGTQTHYRAQLKPLTGHIGEVLIKDLTGLILEPLIGSSWHRAQAVKRVLRYADDLGAELPARNPLRAIRPPYPPRRERTLSRLEMIKLLRASAPPLRELLVFLRHTAARPGEGRNLKWSQRTDDGMFALRSYKGKNRRKDAAKFRYLAPDSRGQRLIERLAKRPAGG